MKESREMLNLSPGWVRRVVDRGVQQAMLILKATNLYASNIFDKVGSGAPSFPNGLKTDTLQEETSGLGITLAHKATFSNASILMTNLPTSSTGLSAGALYVDSGTLKVKS